MIKSYKDMDVYNRSYDLAVKVFELSKKFPKQEVYSLTSQLIRSSRSISANVVEGWAKREYENVFKQHLVSALGSCSESQNWLRFAKDCNYISEKEYIEFDEEFNIVAKMLTKLHQNWRKL